MPSSALLDHFRNPRNVGELTSPAVCVDAVNPACGDILRLCVRIEGEQVTAAGFKARGCPASIAAGSALTELLIGIDRAGAARMSPEDIEQALDGLDPASKHAAHLCIDAIKILLTKWD
jgi:nitrogen fixation NifU-like protein